MGEFLMILRISWRCAACEGKKEDAHGRPQTRGHPGWVVRGSIHARRVRSRFTRGWSVLTSQCPIAWAILMIAGDEYFAINPEWPAMEPDVRPCLIAIPAGTFSPIVQ